jgi:CO/xanthine dehydrogenase FAD-binding subunit
MPFLVATNSTFERNQRRSVHRRRFNLQSLGKIGELLDFVAIDRLEQRPAGREMPIERADADAGVARHRVEAGIRSAGAEHRFRRRQHPCVIANGIGARVRNADLAHDAAFARRFPAVAEALLSGASAQLRNAATVGSNLLQRTRCAYFYDVASACNKRQPGAGCEARGGDTRLHAVLGWRDRCIATNPSDFCVPLVAFDAMVEVAGNTGHRDVPLEDFHRLPGETPERESALEPGELILAVRLPAAAALFSAHARHLKVRDRTSYAFAVVSVAAALRIEGGIIAEVRIALGGVALKPWRARAAEAGLVTPSK